MKYLQGQETSAILLTWALLMLALHPHTQELVFQEVNEVLDGQPPRQLDVSKLRSATQLQLLHCNPLVLHQDLI